MMKQTHQPCDLDDGDLYLNSFLLRSGNTLLQKVIKELPLNILHKKSYFFN